MVKNIIFDLGGVILLSKPNGVLKSIKLDKNKIDDIDNQFFQKWRDLDLGKLTLKEHLNNCKFDFEITKEIEDKLVHYYQYRPVNNEMIKLIEILKKSNYKLYILSNNNIDAKKYLVTLPFFKYFDGYIFSCDYGLLKPDVEIYNKLFQKYQLVPSECFFLDDKKKNIDSAKSLGMEGFIYNYNVDKIEGIIKQIDKLNH